MNEVVTFFPGLQDLHEVVQELPKTEAFEQADFMSGAADAEKQLKEAEG